MSERDFSQAAECQIAQLPSEIIQNIISHLYDPLKMTQADRLTWNIFSSFGDNLPSRRQGLTDLVAFGMTGKSLWREVRPSLFRCIRVADEGSLAEVTAPENNWAKHVKSLIVDMSLFEENEVEEGQTAPLRNPWFEARALHHLVSKLPSLEHLSFFADGSDDLSLALFFDKPDVQNHIGSRLRSFGWRARSETPFESRLFANSSMFVSFSEFFKGCPRLGCVVLDSNAETISMSTLDLDLVMTSLQQRQIEVTRDDCSNVDEPLPPKLTLMLLGRMNQWRPVEDDLDLARSHPCFPKLGDRSIRLDRNSAIPSVQLAQPIQPYRIEILTLRHGDGDTPERHSLLPTTACASIEVAYSDKVEFDLDWETRVNFHSLPGLGDHPATRSGFLGSVNEKMETVKEIFLDRPSIQMQNEPNLLEQLITALLPLAHLPYLRILQVGGYPMDDEDRSRVMEIVLQLCPQILICGWWSLDEDVAWYAIWRDRHRDCLVDKYMTEVTRDAAEDRRIEPDLAVNQTGRPRRPRYLIKPLAEGELFALEAEQAAYEHKLRYSRSRPKPSLSPS